MSELRVPTLSFDAEVVCADGRAFHGRVFVPPASPNHEGPMRVTEWMNDRMPFFPFRPDDGPAFIMNKDEVVVLSVGAEAEGASTTVAETAPHRGVSVECRDRTFRGAVAIDMPPGHQRLTDHLNRPDPFLILEDGDRRHLVRKSRITRVLED